MKTLSQGAMAVAVAIASLAAAAAQEMPEAFPLEQLLVRASVDGKYSNLLRAIDVEEDFDDYGPFHDYGYWSGGEWRGHTDLPAGYWVYLYPCWYIWGESTQPIAVSPEVVQVAEPRQVESVTELELSIPGLSTETRRWGPEQATGPPDTHEAGDIPTAWASRTRDDRDEWLLLSYAEPVVPVAVVVYETYNPGAVYRVTAVDSEGEETELWSGDDPTSVDQEKGISVIVPPEAIETQHIAVYLKSSEVAGWNEIDAVGVLDAAGTVHWAAGALGSTTYADANANYDTVAEVMGTTYDPEAPESLERRIRELEAEVRHLRSQLDSASRPPISRLLFDSARDASGRDYEVYCLDWEGVQRNLTDNPAWDSRPAWSPSGQSIAFNSTRSGDVELYVMQADGSGLRRLTNSPSMDWEPTWSGDGTRLAFSTFRDGYANIYVISVDGTGLTRLTEDDANDWEPCWSLVGDRIVFSSNRSGHYQIYAMDADGSNVVRITDDNADNQMPKWSPDGQRIAFQSNRDGNNEIYVMNADGSDQQRLTDDPELDEAPSWSPDGERIAFMSRRDGDHEIFVINADGTHLEQITNNTWPDRFPAWPLLSRPVPGAVDDASPEVQHGCPAGGDTVFD